MIDPDLNHGASHTFVITVGGVTNQVTKAQAKRMVHNVLRDYGFPAVDVTVPNLMTLHTLTEEIQP